MSAWTAESYEPDFSRWVRNELDEYEQSVLFAAIEQVLQVQGPEICRSEFGRSLGDGLVEFRVRQSINAIENFGKTPLESRIRLDGARTVLLRVFVHFHGQKVILLMHGLNKAKDNNEKRQNREIKRARQILKDWKQEQQQGRKRT